MKNLLSVVISLLIGIGAGIFYSEYLHRPPVPLFGSSIKYAEGVSLADTFKNVRAPAMESCVTRRFPTTIAPGYHETRAVWYSYKEIQGFLNTMDKEYPNSRDKLGIRIYLGAYPKVGDFGTKPEDAHRMTAFFVATLKQARTTKPNIVVDSDMVDKSKGDRSMWTFLGINPYNHGTLCPPQDSCGGTAF